MAGNITVKAGSNVLGTIAASGIQFGVPNYLLGSSQILYRYANLTLPYSPNDPGLLYTYQNPGAVPHVTLAVKFFNLLNEPSTPSVLIDVGSAGAPTTSGAVQPECLDVRNYGAVGDGVTNDTAAIQCALDQAARNWNAQQSAIAQKQPLTNPGSTIVCIPAGYTFAVGGNFWGSTCGRAWGTNGNWPVNPYDVALANGTWYDTFFGKSGTAGRNIDGALFVRSGVTVQLDGTVLRIEPQAFGSFESTTVFCIFDDQVSNYLASNVTFKGVGTIDGNGLTAVASGESALGGFSGDCIFAMVSQNLTIQGITIKNALRWGIELYTGPTVWPTTGGYTYPTAPTVYTDAPLSNTNIFNLTMQNCGLLSLSNGRSLIGGIQIIGAQVNVSNCSFSYCENAVWFNGKQIVIDTNIFTNCGANTDKSGNFLSTSSNASVIIVGLSNSCSVVNNTIQGGGSYLTQAGNFTDSQGGPVPTGYPAGNSGSAIRVFYNITPLKIHKATDIPSPMYPIDYLYSVAITGNTINTFYGVGIAADQLITSIPGGYLTGYYSLLSINSNNIDGCTGFGIYYAPTTWGNVLPCPTPLFPDGLNFGCTILDDNFGTNGLGEGITIAFDPRAGSGTTYNTTPPGVPLFFGICQQLSIGAQIWGPLALLSKMSPLTTCCLTVPDSSIFGPFRAMPYHNLSYGGFGTATSDGMGALAISSGSVQNFPLSQVINEVPGGNVDGSNKTFTLKNAPFPKASVQILQTGTTNLSASGGITITPTNFVSTAFVTNYVVTGNTITFGTAPPSGISLAVSYTYLPPQPS